MAELPELEYLLKVFTRELAGKRIVESECLNPEPVTNIIGGDFAERLTDLKITKIKRRGPFIILRTNSDERLVVQPEEGGFFKFPGLGTRRPRSLIFVLHMEGGPRLWFLDNGESARVYLTSKKRLEEVPMLMEQGADPMGKNFTPERFRRIAKRKAESTIREMLMDQRDISHIGTVYADEILFDALIHPQTKVEDLSEDELDRIYDSTLNVLENAIEIIEDRGQPIENTVRDFLKVWNRKGDPCRKCGGEVETLKFGVQQAFYCPRCQSKKKS